MLGSFLALFAAILLGQVVGLTRAYDHNYTSNHLHKRMHSSLTWCENNPLVRMLNKTHVLELERGEWQDWEHDVLLRTMNMAKNYGKGLDHYLAVNNWFDAEIQAPPCATFHNAPVKGALQILDMFYPTKTLCPCPTALGKIGDESAKAGDTSKIICGVEEQLHVDDCIVYSLGSHNQFDFEENLSKRFPNCKIFTYDCTSGPPPTPIHNVFFEKVCLGSSDVTIAGKGQFHTYKYLIEKNEHKFIQLLKMDIEGYEMEVFVALLRPPYSKSLPFQLSFETHHFHGAFQSALLHQALFAQLKDAGYRPVSFENNVQCPSCNEHTFIRVYC